MTNKKPEIYNIKNFSILLLPTTDKMLYVSSIINNGFVTETKNTSGINHLLEHILFDSWEKCDKKKCDLYWSNKAVRYNGQTKNSVLKYYIYGLDSYREDLLDYIINITVAPKFNEDILEQNKKIVMNELYINFNKPENQLYNMINKSFYKKTGLQYSSDSLQQIDNLKTITLDAIKKCYKKYYNSSNIIFVVAGNFNKKSILDAFKNKLPNNKGDINLINNCFTYKQKLVFVKNDKAKNTIFNINFPIDLFQNNKNYLYLTMAMQILQEDLFLLLRSQNDLTYGIQINFEIFNCGSIINIHGSCLDKNITIVLKLIINYIKYLQKTGIDEKNFVSTKDKFLLNYYNTKYTPVTLSNFYEQQYINQINNSKKIIFSPKENMNIIRNSKITDIKSSIDLLDLDNILCGYMGKNSYNLKIDDIMCM